MPDFRIVSLRVQDGMAYITREFELAGKTVQDVMIVPASQMIWSDGEIAEGKR